MGRFLDKEPTYKGKFLADGKSKKKGLYAYLGAEVTPRMEQEYPYTSATAKTLQEGVATPALHFLNQASANTLRSVAESQGIEYPEPTTLPGQILAKSAGVGGAFFAPVKAAQSASKYLTMTAPRAIANKFNNPFIRKAARVISRPGVHREAIQGAITGGLTAPMYAPEGDPLNIAKRAATIPMGAAIGAFAQPAIAGASNIFSKFVDSRKPTFITKSSGEKGVPFKSLTPEERIANRQARAERIASGKKDVLNKQIEGIKSQDEKFINTLNEYKKEITSLGDKELYNLSQESALKLKSKVPEFNNKFSEKYGKIVDDIGEKLAQSGDNISQSQVDDIISRTISELTDEGLPITNNINKLKAKYSMEQIGEGGEKIISQDGNIPIREFLSDMRGAIKGTNERVFTGAKARSEGQISDMILKRNFGDYLAEKSPEFSELQKQSRPIIEGVKMLRKKIQPYSEYATKEPTGFIQKYSESAAKGKTDIGTQKALKLVEEGTQLLGEELPGVGKVSENVISTAKSLNKQMAVIEEAISTRKNMSSENISNIKSQIATIEKTLDQRKDSIIRGFAGKQRYDLLRRKLAVLQNIIKYSLIGAGSSYAVPRTAGRLMHKE